jgi:hypothetical protein
MAVWAVWLDGALWLSTGAESRKARNLAARADCVVTTERADEPVVIEGRAERVLDPAAIAAFQDAYEAKYAFRPTTELGPIFRVAPRVAFGFVENAADFPGSATRWSFG